MIPGHTKENCKKEWCKIQKIKVEKNIWKKKEDNILKEIVANKVTLNWTEIAIEFNKSFPDNERTRKQCRNRWEYCLKPYIKKHIYYNN